MKELMKAYLAITAGAVIGIVFSYPLQAGLNHIAKVMCKDNPDRGLVKYKDPVFPQEKFACIPRKYI